MKINSRTKEIYKVSFGYHYDLYGYTTLMLDIMKLCNMPILKRILHIKTIIIDPVITNDIKVPVRNVHIS